jgi:GT2 family glycosyltransferase
VPRQPRHFTPSSHHRQLSVKCTIDHAGDADCDLMALTIAAVVCAYNEDRYLPACLFSLKTQTRPPDDIIVVNNASTDRTAIEAHGVPGVRVIDEPQKGLVIAREAARRFARADVLAFLDADCRAPIWWLERIEQRLARSRDMVAATGPYRFYDWHRNAGCGRRRGATAQWAPVPSAGCTSGTSGRRFSGTVQLTRRISM